MTSFPAPELDAAHIDSSRFRRFAVLSALALLSYALPLWQLVRFSLANDLYSFTVLVPFISGYLLWTDRHLLQPGGIPASRLWPLAFAAAAASLLALSFTLGPASAATRQDILSCRIYSLVFAIYAIAAGCLGRSTLHAAVFPLGFLVFLAPFPRLVETSLESGLQHASSVAAHFFFDLSGMPVLREGTYFQLPGFNMEVAPECSGIRSTLALFLTSLVAGHLFLRSRWNRGLIAAIVIPIAIVRNGFRVFVIGELCVRISHDMIHHWIHRKGGPIFFALSLVPFGIILFFIYRSDRRTGANRTPEPSPTP